MSAPCTAATSLNSQNSSCTPCSIKRHTTDVSVCSSSSSSCCSSASSNSVSAGGNVVGQGNAGGSAGGSGVGVGGSVVGGGVGNANIVTPAVITQKSRTIPSDKVST